MVYDSITLPLSYIVWQIAGFELAAADTTNQRSTVELYMLIKLQGQLDSNQRYTYQKRMP